MYKIQLAFECKHTLLQPAETSNRSAAFTGLQLCSSTNRACSATAGLLRSNCAVSPGFWLSTIQSWWINTQGHNIWNPFILKGVYTLRTLQQKTVLWTHTEIKLGETCARWRHFYIQPTRGTTETGEDGRSIIIRREEWRKKATVLSPRCRDNKIRPCVIHLRPWHSAPPPPTTRSVSCCAQPLFHAVLCYFPPKFLFIINVM